MILALACPQDSCRHAFRATDPSKAADQMIAHLTGAHELPEISAAYHASIARPVPLDDCPRAT